MLTKAEVKLFVKGMDSYIQSSAVYAANFFNQNHINHVFWDDVVMQLSPGMCEQIYKDLIEDALLHGKVVSFKYGMTITVYQCEDQGEAHCGIQLGLGFPYISKL